MKPSRPSLRKASILVASLEPHEASRILAEMAPEQRRALAAAVAALGPIDPAEQTAVIEEFFRIGPLGAARKPAGVELDLQRTAPEPAAALPATTLATDVAARTLPHDTYAVHTLGSAAEIGLPAEPPAGRGAAWTPNVTLPAGERPRMDAARPGNGFESLHERDGRELALALAGERPQTIAVVVSHLPAERAAALLGQLPSECQAEVARRLVELEVTSPEILRELERGLERRLSQAGLVRDRMLGVGALSGILAAADHATRERLLASLRLHDHDLASQLALAAPQPAAAPQAGASRSSASAPAPGARGAASPAATRLVEVTFADLEHWNDEALIQVMHAADTEVLVLALAGASNQLVRRVLEQLPSAEGRALRFAIEHLGPTRLADVEEAQRRLAALAATLRRAGQMGQHGVRSLSVAV